jgi:SET and MYND domain-containing protein
MAGIYLDAGLAMVNHSCVPNAFIGFDKRTAILRAERDIREGEEITISYIGKICLGRAVETSCGLTRL